MEFSEYKKKFYDPVAIISFELRGIFSQIAWSSGNAFWFGSFLAEKIQIAAEASLHRRAAWATSSWLLFTRLTSLFLRRSSLVAGYSAFRSKKQSLNSTINPPLVSLVSITGASFNPISVHWVIRNVTSPFSSPLPKITIFFGRLTNARRNLLYVLVSKFGGAGFWLATSRNSWRLTSGRSRNLRRVDEIVLRFCRSFAVNF